MAKPGKSKTGNQATPLPAGAGSGLIVDDEHSTLIEYVNSSDDATLDSRELSEKCRRYYDSDQWTSEERLKLSKQKQAATVINRIKPKMDGLMGMEKANRTTVKTFPRTPKHEQGSTASTEAIRFVLQDNFYHQIRSAAWENALIEGTMGVEVVVEPKKEDYRITVRHLMWDRLIYDPHSRRKDFSDARYLGQVVWMDYDEAVEKYPDAKDVLESMQAGSATYDDQPKWMDNTRRRVKVVELYYRREGEIKYACFTRGGYCESPRISPYVNEEGETEWPYEFASLFVERSGGRYGAVRQYLDVQDEINKRRSKALHLMSVRQVRWERGAVEDINQARGELAKPDGVLETTPGMEFEVLKTNDMAQAQFNLLAEAKMEIDAVGYNAAASGKDTRDMSGVALRTREMSAQTELGPMFDVLRHLDIRVYRKIWNRIRQYWKSEKWIRITDDENNLRWVGLNKPVTRGEQMLREAAEQGAPQEMLQQMKEKISQDEMMSEVVSTENEIAELDVDLVIADAPDAVTTQVQDFQVLGEMVKSGFPMPPLAVIEASPLSNKDKIIKMMKETPQISPQHQKQMEQMQETMEKLQKEAQKLAQENQALKASQQEEMARLEMDRRKAEEELKLEREKAAAELELERSKAEAELNLEREKAQAEIALEREKAGAQTSLEKDKIAANVDVQKTKLKGDLAVKSVELRQELDPEEADKKAAESAMAEQKRLSEILEESKRQTAEIVNAIVSELRRPKTRTANYKGQTISVTEH